MNDLELLAQNGYPDASLLAVGMESSVYLLSDERVGKIPHAARTAMEDALSSELSRCCLPFAVPTSLGATTLSDGRRMTIERVLPGRPLDDFYDPVKGDLDQPVIEALGDVLDGLHGLVFDVPSRTILDGEPYDATTKTWADALVDIGRRRFARFGSTLKAGDPTVGQTASDLLTFLSSRGHVTPQIAHGDICGANVLVDDVCRVSALLDWGFLSVLAEQEFDIAIATSVFDMYGPHAAATEATLTDAILARHASNRDVVLAYKGIYALLTSNVYSPNGTDGHFAWCSAMLARPAVRAAAATLASGIGTSVAVGM